jgi:exopolysaccharide biosynthesis protein
MLNNIHFLALIFSLMVSISGTAQSNHLSKNLIPFNSKGIKLYMIDSDSLFPGKQHIVLAEIKEKSVLSKNISLVFSDTLLKPTSQFAEEANAVLALNGGFFNVEKGGSVAYLESDGNVISRTRTKKETWAKTDSVLNGAIVLENSGKLKIEMAKPTSYYEQSALEKFVLISGPILLTDGKKLALENSKFVNTRHPRSCMCQTTDSTILFVAIDGRSETAAGMDLKETQQFLLWLKCKNAINLDGGGSTTLWVNDGKEKKVLNKPSDKKGERPVANIIAIKSELN